jgi:hypothetical protein
LSLIIWFSSFWSGNPPVRRQGNRELRRSSHQGKNIVKKRKLGNSGLEVAKLALGGNVFGWTADSIPPLRAEDHGGHDEGEKRNPSNSEGERQAI